MHVWLIWFANWELWGCLILSGKFGVVGMIGLLLQTWECLNVLFWLAV